MKLNWFMRRLKFKTPSPKRRRVLRGPVFVPRLEPLEDRSLPSGLPTITLSDGTVWQLVPASNNSSAFIAGGAVNTNVDLLYVASLESSVGMVMVNSISNPIVQVTNSFSLSPWTATAEALIVSPQATSVTVLNAVQGVFTVLSLSPTATGSAATSYSITIQTIISPQNISQNYNITGLDANGHLTGDFASAIQVANPLTNQLPLPSSKDGQMNFVLNIPLDGSNGSFTNNAGLCLGCFGNLPLLMENGSDSFFFATDGPLDDSVMMKVNFTITNPNSLVLADTGLNVWLNYVVIQDAGFRSTSSLAQVTWLGMRGPPEPPLAHAERGKATDFWTNLIRDQSEKEPTSSSLEERFPILPTAHSRPMEAMVREILSSLPQAKRDEKDDVTLAALLPPSNPDEKTRRQVAKAWPFVLTGILESKPKAQLVSLIVPLPVSRKDAELITPARTLDPANNEGIEAALAEEGVSSRFANAGSERSRNSNEENARNSSQQIAQSKWIGWLEGLGGFLLMVGGPVALLDNLAAANAGLPEDNDAPDRPRLAT
jgi:hypothetical protein